MQAKRALHSKINHSTVLFAVLATIALVFIAAAQEKVANVKTVPIAYTILHPGLKCTLSTAQSAMEQQATGTVLPLPYSRNHLPT